MDFSQMNIEEDLSINKYQLDAEAISLPSLYFRYADAVREAKALVSENQDNLKVVLAERNIAIREECATNGIKVTEGIISAKVDADAEVNNARKELRNAEAILGRLNVALSALETKKSEIDNLVKLYCNSYYANKDANGNNEFKSEMISTDLRKNMNTLPN